MASDGQEACYLKLQSTATHPVQPLVVVPQCVNYLPSVGDCWQVGSVLTRILSPKPCTCLYCDINKAEEESNFCLIINRKVETPKCKITGEKGKRVELGWESGSSVPTDAQSFPLRGTRIIDHL